MEKSEIPILWIRGEAVILDSDLASLYGVKTGRLNEQVKRNAHRFPLDFVFQLTLQKKRGSSQNATTQIKYCILEVYRWCLLSMGR